MACLSYTLSISATKYEHMFTYLSGYLIMSGIINIAIFDCFNKSSLFGYTMNNMHKIKSYMYIYTTFIKTPTPFICEPSFY